MPIPFTCESCGHSMKAPSKFAGKRVRCKQCNEFTPIPELESDDAPGFNAYAFDDEPVIPKRSARRDADDLLGESPPPQEVLPKRIGPGQYDDGPRRERDGYDEAPVLGMEVGQAVWIFLGGLALIDVIEFGRVATGVIDATRVGILVGTYIGQVIQILLNTGVMMLAGKVVEIEPSSGKRMLAIALALAVTGGVIGLTCGILIPDQPLVPGLVALVCLCVILSRTLQLGCFGLIAFVFVQSVIVIGTALALYGLFKGFAPK